MLVDLVVDTNVFMHADDGRQARKNDAAKLLQELLNGTTQLCVDEGFDLDEAKNKSLIGGEYLERLTGASTAMPILAYMFANRRFHFVSRSVPQEIKKQIQQCIRDKRDRTFIAVAHNSDERLLCSHDHVDMSTKKRSHLKGKVGVSILEASEILSLF